jgi:hypothetical protein
MIETTDDLAEGRVGGRLQRQFDWAQSWGRPLATRPPHLARSTQRHDAISESLCDEMRPRVGL